MDWVLKKGILIAVIVSLQLLCQLLIQLLLVRTIGVGQDTDAYIAAQAVPTVFGAVIATALQSVWLPRLAVLSKNLNKWRSEQSAAQGQAAILAVALLVLFGSSVQIWLPMLYPGFDSEHQQSSIQYSIILFVALSITLQSAMLTVGLRTRARFASAEMISTLGTALSLVALYFTLPIYGVVAAAWVTLARAVVVLLMQLHLADWPLFSFQNGWRAKDTWQLMLPLLFGSSIYKTSPVVDRYWASQVQVGGITILNLAQSAITAASTVLERALGVPIIPNFARLVESGKYTEIRTLYMRFLLKIALITVLLGLIFFLVKGYFEFLFEQLLKIDEGAAGELWLLIIFMLGHLFAAVTGAVLVSVFYALGDTKTPVVIGIVGFVFGLLLKWILFSRYALAGLAIATSIYFLINIILFVLSLDKKTINLRRRNEI